VTSIESKMGKGKVMGVGDVREELERDLSSRTSNARRSYCWTAGENSDGLMAI
jgi:hypothetical protein